MADTVSTNTNLDCESCDPYADTDIDRQFPRTDIRSVAEATIYPLPGQPGEPICREVMVRDLSSHGFGLTLDAPLHPQQRVEFNIDQQRLVGEVQWSRQIQPKIHLVGCRLLSSSA
jgi:hypothetical protein